ncbi:hypothetical protein [uncultured Fibrella sp.]|uniref:hypothetical protein n=1 Tax=uncultured Fibrella sp. TaxID=1284596 RepID=UPI0035CAF95F
MRLITTVFASLLSILFFCTCKTQPDVETVYKSLKAGEARIIVSIDGDDFYPDDSRFSGEVTVSPNTVHMNLFDQYESNVIFSLGDEALFAKRPISRPIVVDQPSAGSVMIGRVNDRAKRTGDGFIMTQGDATVESLSDEKVVVRLSGKTGNFNTMRDPKTWKSLEALLVYKRPKLMMRGDTTRSLLY